MGKSTEEILGCDFSRKTYYEYIQNKFTGDMSYDKMNELHIDHVISLGAPEKMENLPSASLYKRTNSKCD
jgi:hypothetical protein